MILPLLKGGHRLRPYQSAMTVAPISHPQRIPANMVADAMMALSVVIPVRNEAENIAALARELNIALSQHIPFETIFVDDGSSDDSVSVLEACMQTLPQLRIVRHDWHGGQSAAIHSGVLAARAPIICTLDGDGQNPPRDFPGL
jgi:dolichol-phosphate mannosyltransferase